MPVRVDSNDSNQHGQGPGRRFRKPPHLPAEISGPCVTIGLINNMPEAAFQATERQFVSLLESASEGIPVCLSLYVLPPLSKTASTANLRGSRYSNVEMLWNKNRDTHRDAGLDALIVTGREPMMPDLRDEPYWPSFTTILDWARANTYSAVWSCLAAHAAVLHMDGIDRRRSEEKRSGIYEFARVSGHRLMAGTPQRLQVPHSRWNGVAEKELVGRGYGVLTRGADAEVDMFVKEEQSLFVFFQGHPEYESDTLLREYRRDVGRYLRGATNTYPSLPRDYFDRSTEEALTALRKRALACRSKELLASFATVLERAVIKNTWHCTATRIYRNWLEYICERKSASGCVSG